MKSVKCLIIISILATAGCNAKDAGLIRQSVDKDTIWVYAQFNVPKNDQINTSYDYGRISKDLYDQIINGTVKNRFILLRDVRYYNTDDKLVKYEDETDTGDLVFRVADLRRIYREKGDPLILKHTEETTQSTIDNDTSNPSMDPASADAHASSQ